MLIICFINDEYFAEADTEDFVKTNRLSFQMNCTDVTTAFADNFRVYELTTAETNKKSVKNFLRSAVTFEDGLSDCKMQEILLPW